MNSHIRIPLISVGGSEEHIDIYPDELPDDHNDLIDILKSELAPFQVWRACATEYHRQGFDVEFDLILKEIVGALCVPDVSEIYKQRDDYAEGITEIFVALAAKSLDSLAKSRASCDVAEQHSFYAKQVVSALESADENHRMNEYTWIIKGFFEIIQGDKKRAEDFFRTVYDRASKGQNYALKKHLFVSLLGLGLVAYANEKYQVALDHFSNAINNNPNCTASVRLVVACCCFKLGQYERSKLAAERAFALEPGSTKTLVLLALIDQAIAKSDRSAKLTQSVNSAFEYCMVASAIEPHNSSVLNLLANHYFQNWTPVPADNVSIVDETHLLMPKLVAILFQKGDEIRLNADNKFTGVIASILVNDDDTATQALVELKAEHGHRATSCHPFLPSVASTITCVEIKELGRVQSFAEEALKHTSFGGIKADSLYILGKVQHSKGNIGAALGYYKSSQRESPEMTLSTFAIGQILVAERDFTAALEYFERTLLRHTDDKDTQAYVSLLRGATRKELTSFDKLREIAPGFQHEVDLWLSQAQLRLEKNSDHATALKCYMHAKDCMEQASIPLPSFLLSNIAVLHHNIGKLDTALSFSRLALITAAADPSMTTDQDRASCSDNLMRCADLEGVFYSWSDPICVLRKTDVSECNGTVQFEKYGPELVVVSSAEWSKLAIIGDDVQIGGVLHTVSSLDDSGFKLKASSVVKILTPVDSNATEANEACFHLQVKQYYGNCNDRTLTYCYNFAYLLETAGLSKAAAEVYLQLLKHHPGFIECYIRLSSIEAVAGRYEEALNWLKRGQTVNEEDIEVIAAMGELYQQIPTMWGGHLGRGASGSSAFGQTLAAVQNGVEARKCFEKILTKIKGDPRAMLSMGNMHLNSAAVAKMSRKGTQDNMLKDSYKFFYHVMSADNRNAFGANGLGVVCAEKGQLDAAKEIFFKIREAQFQKTEDATNNLANVFLQQGRFPDAERLFQSTLKSMNSNNITTSNKVQARATTSSSAALIGYSSASHHLFPAELRQHLHECVALSQNRLLKNEESARSLLHAVHISPHASLQDWYNVGTVYENAALLLMKKRHKSLREILDAINDIELAKEIFGFLLNSPGVTNYQQQVPIEKRYVQAHWNMCTNNLISFTDALENARAEEAARQEETRRREETHEERLRAKREEMERLNLQKENEKNEKKSLAVQKLKQLEELQEKWIAVPVSAPTVEPKQRKRGARKGGGPAGDGDLAQNNYDVAGADDDVIDFEIGDTTNAILDHRSDSASAPVTGTNGIDFGSSDDEDELLVARKSNTADLSSIEKDFFGDDDDDEDDDNLQKTVDSSHQRLKRKLSNKDGAIIASHAAKYSRVVDNSD